MKLISIIFIIMFMSSANASAKTLKASIPDWTGGEITCQVAVSILENELGYKVKRVSMPSGTGLWEAVARGEIDFACESWPSYAEADDYMLNGKLVYDGKVVKEYNGNGSVEILGTTGVIGSSDYWVPKYFIDANPDFRDWKDLNRFKNQFSTKDTGRRGRLIACAVAGWNCHDQKRLDLLGIDFEAELLGTEVRALAEAQAAYDRREPFLMYLWEPHWFFGKNEMVRVNLPEFKYCSNFTLSNNWRDCGDRAWPATGWEKDYTLNYGNPKTFSDPYYKEAKNFFKNMNLNNMDQSKMLYQVQSSGMTVYSAVNLWKNKNQNTILSWLGKVEPVTKIAEISDEERIAAEKKKEAAEEKRKAAAEEKRKAQQNEAAEEEKRKELARLEAEEEFKRKNAIKQMGSGSGFFINSNGYIASNFHVTDGCMEVRLGDENLKVVRNDIVNDIAILKSKDTNNSYIKIAEEGAIKGEDVFVLGFPHGKHLSSESKVTKGVVSALQGLGNNYSQLQIDAAIQPGNSGGPVVNEKGELIGVTVATADYEVMFDMFKSLPQNMNFAIKSQMLTNILKGSKIDYEEPQASWFSFGSGDAQDAIAEVDKATVYLECWSTELAMKEAKESAAKLVDTVNSN